MGAFPFVVSKLDVHLQMRGVALLLKTSPQQHISLISSEGKYFVIWNAIFASMTQSFRPLQVRGSEELLAAVGRTCVGLGWLQPGEKGALFKACRTFGRGFGRSHVFRHAKDMNMWAFPS